MFTNEDKRVNLSFITLVVGIINLSLMFLALYGAYYLHSPMGFAIGCIILSMVWYCYLGYHFVKSLNRMEDINNE